jgi:hypothetical protein
MLWLPFDACKLTEKSTVSLAVQREAQRDGAWLSFEGRDAGCGLPPSSRDACFRLQHRSEIRQIRSGARETTRAHVTERSRKCAARLRRASG